MFSTLLNSLPDTMLSIHQLVPLASAGVLVFIESTAWTVLCSSCQIACINTGAADLLTLNNLPVVQAVVMLEQERQIRG